jgi:hypothetical protein
MGPVSMAPSFCLDGAVVHCIAMGYLRHRRVWSVGHGPSLLLRPRDGRGLFPLAPRSGPFFLLQLVVWAWRSDTYVTVTFCLQPIFQQPTRQPAHKRAHRAVVFPIEPLKRASVQLGWPCGIMRIWKNSPVPSYMFPPILPTACSIRRACGRHG